MSVTKPIGTAHDDAVLLASVLLSCERSFCCVLLVILSTVPLGGGRGGMLAAAKLQVAAGKNNRSPCPCFATG